jgi:hypothetical protein
MTEQFVNFFLIGFAAGGISGGLIVAGIMVWAEERRRGNYYDW